MKVIYRNPNNHGKQVIKDLYQDICAEGFSTLGHMVASRLIQPLQGKPSTLPDLLKILHTRTTSWARDRLTIAALLAQTNAFKYTDSLAETTRKIIGSYQSIPQQFLLHGHSTLSDTGGFSWCPSNLLYSDPLGQNSEHWEPVHVDAEGAAWSYWDIEPLNSAHDLFGLQPHGFNLAVDVCIRLALEKWDYCLLLHRVSPEMYTGSSDAVGPPLCVVAVCSSVKNTQGQALPPPFLECHYVGCVFKMHSAPRDNYAVRIGSSAPATMSAQEALRNLEALIEQRLNREAMARYQV